MSVAQATPQYVWGALIHPSRCVFVDESAETIASEDVIGRILADKP